MTHGTDGTPLGSTGTIHGTDGMATDGTITTADGMGDGILIGDTTTALDMVLHMAPDISENQ